MNKKAYRQEIKQLLSPAQALLLEQRIAAIMQRDTNAGENGSYYIRSIYFDTLDGNAYNEKKMGICEREKIRIRFYNFNTDSLKLEKKEKRETLIHKDTLTIDPKTANELLNGNFESLLSLKQPLAKEIYGKSKEQKLVPAVIVDYSRRAYTYPVGNVRITFDSCLQSQNINEDFWSRGTLHSVLDNNVILEVKFNKFLPEHIRQIITSVPGQRIALSKYTLCRENLRRKHGDYIGGN